MDTGKNELSAEMFEKLKECISNKEYPDAGDILTLVEGETITDNHNRRLVDPSIFKLRGKILRGTSDEITRKFQEYVESETEIPPYEMITIDSVPELIKEQAEYDAILYGDSFVPVNRAPRWVERYLETQRWIDGIRDPEIDILTGCTKNFKPQQKIDMLEAVFNMLDADKPDRNGRIWQKELLAKQLMKPMWMIPPRHHKSWMWMKLLQMQSFEIQQRTLMNPPSTKWDINSVIHMHWPKPDLSDLKPEVGKIDDLMVMDYITETFGPIDQMMINSFMRHWPELVKKSPSPNLNDNNKKALERVIKKGRKRK